jgi:hypothetical protein
VGKVGTKPKQACKEVSPKMNTDMPNETLYVDKRQEKRLEFESLLLPFLGSRMSDHFCFEYIPMDISFNGLGILIPNWVVSRELLKNDERIHLHLPFYFSDQSYTRGNVMWNRWDEDMQGQLYGIQMKDHENIFYPLYIQTDTRSVNVDLSGFDTTGDLMESLLKDAVLLKKGILIYLNHLIPYFSRLGGRSKQDYDQLKTVLFEDMKRLVMKNLKYMEVLYGQTKSYRQDKEIVLQNLNLDQLREAVRSEISLDVLKVALDTDAVTPYLSAIETLEEKQYTNYNLIVMLYIHEITE